jgi:phage-related protein
MASTQAVYYRDRRGVEPAYEFLNALAPKRRAKVAEFVDVYLNGRPPEAPPPEFPITSQVDGELRELRVRFAQTRYRLLYQRSGNLVVLLHGIEKNMGRDPARRHRRRAPTHARLRHPHRLLTARAAARCRS